MRAIDTIMEEARRSLLAIDVVEGDNKAKIYYSGYYTLNYKRMEEDEIREELQSFSSKTLVSVARKITARNKRYLTAKCRLVKLAMEVAKNDSELMKLIDFIDVVCTPYPYIGNANRWYIGGDTHLRLTGKDGWSSEGPLHLQKVVTLDGGIMLFHRYPKAEEKELLKEFLASK